MGRGPGSFLNAVGLTLTLLLASWVGSACAERAAMAAPASGAQSKSFPGPIEIDRVEVSGVTVFQQPDIESALELVPGDRLDRAKLIQTEQNLQALYRIHGYEQVSIQSRLSRKQNEQGQMEAVLEFDVKEGKPTRVAQIRFAADGQRGPTFEKYWRHLSSDLAARSGLLMDDVFDQEKITAGKRGLLDLLASEEFIGAKVDDVRVSTAAQPDFSQLPQGSPRDASRWVSVEFHVDLGERVSFGFRGNKVFPETRLNALIDEQRVLGFGKDYVTSIRDRIIDEYRAQGYAHVAIDAFSFENEPGLRHVTYVINEGPRVRIEAIDFDGNSIFTSDELRGELYDRGSVIMQHGYYSESDVQKASELLVEWMKSKGYLSAKLVTINTEFPAKPRPITPRSFARLMIYIYEGDETIVRDINLNGVKALSPSEVKEILGIKENEPLNLFAFSEGIEKLKSAFRARGYLGVAITNEGTDRVIKYSAENRIADITLDVDEGLQYRVSHVQIEGLTKTHDHVVARELLFREGEVLREPDILGSETRLHRLGLFSSISIRPIDDPDKQGFKIVRVSLTEGTPGVASTGVGLRNDLGVRVFGQAGYANIGGRNESITFNVSANHRFEDFHFVEYAIQLGYVYPYFMNDITTFRPTITLSGTQYIEFDAISAVFALNWERPLTENKALTGIFSYSLERDIQFNAADPIDDQGLRIGAVTPALRLDLRDNPLAPTKGFWSSISLEYANPVLSLGNYNDQEPISYLRVQWRSDYFYPLTRDIQLFLSARFGYERSLSPVVNPNDANSGAIPLIKQFALGGIGSIRGYEEQEINFQSYAIRGSLSYANYRAQVDLPFAGALRIGPFLDVANLIRDHSVLLTQQLDLGSGFGFHYLTPVGPINLDWGWKLNNIQPGSGAHQFYFSIGII